MTRTCTLLTVRVVAAALLFSTIAFAQETREKKTITDQGITDAIERDMFVDKSVPSYKVDVQTSQGIVTLGGTVANLLARDRAVKIAENIRGVRAVVDKLTVTPPALSDEAVRKDVEQALLMDPATDSYETKVAVKDGVATLTGNVQSWQEKELTASVAKGVRGVKAISNEMKIKYTADRPDNQIAADIKGTLQRDVWLMGGSGINVAVKDDKVTLSGSVGSVAQKTRARMDAWVSGVASVDDSKLEVNPALNGKQHRDSKYAYKTGAEIQKAVTDAFLYDPRVLSFNPKVAVNYGTVTLSGVVDNLKAKRAAERDARNTVGVRRVKNNLKVRGQDPPADAEIAKSIKDAFMRSPYVETNEITVSVSNAKATLSGQVDSSYEKWQADDIASGINGVSEVQNNLTVAPLYSWNTYTWPYYTYSATFPAFLGDRDLEIKDEVEDQLFWSPFVDADEITVKVQDGTATLTGTVDSYSERGAAIENAYEGGATVVKNELKVNRQ